jgi:hypothetical protein
MITPSYQSSPELPQNVFVERWFFTGMAVAMLATSIAGFMPSLVHTAGRRAPLSPLAAAHGIVFFAWLLLFLVQSRLVATGQVALHRRLGVTAVFLLALMVPLAYTTTAAMVRRSFDLSGDLRIDHDPLYESIFPFGDITIFAVLVIAALAYRRRAEVHKRLLLFANIILMPAPLAHFIGHTPLLASLPPVIILVPTFDVSNSRSHARLPADAPSSSADFGAGDFPVFIRAASSRPHWCPGRPVDRV